MQLIKVGILVAGVTGLVALGACSADKEAKPAASAAAGPAAVTVNGTPIPQSTVDMIAKQGAGSGRPDTPETRKAIVDRMTLQLILAQEAVKKGLDKSPEVAEQLEAVKQTILANAYIQDLLKNTAVTDEMLKAEYDRIKATASGTEYQARHILVATDAQARDIIARLKKDPGAFARLATERSMDEGSKGNGGELGWFDTRRMVPEFGAAVSKLGKGKFTTEPVKTQFGYHVILLEDSRTIEPPPLDAVKPQLTQQIRQQAVTKQMDELKAKAKIEVAAAPGPAMPAPKEQDDAAKPKDGAAMK
jgi:peptidyl-prolyl cis-trans isomerase C